MYSLIRSIFLKLKKFRNDYLNKIRKYRMFDIYIFNLYKWEDLGMITFYLLPTIEFFRDDINDDIGDYSFDISLNWLFWSLTFTKYWGGGKHIKIK